ncbi:kinase-regulated stress-responsive transcription factor skn7 [Tulasnella sp. UAMH 9824]|nr:kinase-regulated stress-responsive transcription factor skn7 [Tulasnella sp. UAMH 9824]
MEPVEYTSRHRSKRTKRPRSDGSSYSAGSGAQPTLAENRTGFGDAGYLSSSPQIQINNPRQPANVESMETSPTKSFIFKLYDMLHDKSVSSCIHWNETGDAIVIPSIQEFENKALKKHFNIKFDSFVRQLNGWSFEKIGRDKNSGRYRHKDNKFRKGCQDLLHDIKRTAPQHEKALRLDQPAGTIIANLNPESCSQPKGQLELQGKVLHLEEENKSLREAFENLKIQTETKIEALERRLNEALLSLVPGLPKTTSQPHRVAPPSVNPLVAPDGNHLGAVPKQMVNTNSVAPGVVWTSPDGRPLVNSAATQYPTSTAILSLQSPYTTVGRSPPSAGVRLPDDQYNLLYPTSTTTSAPNWLSVPGGYQPAPREPGAPAMVLVQNSPTIPPVVQQRSNQAVYPNPLAQVLPDSTPSTSRFIHHPIPESASLNAYTYTPLGVHEASAPTSFVLFGSPLHQIHTTESNQVEQHQVVGHSYTHAPQTLLQSTAGTLPIPRSSAYLSRGTVAQVPSRHTETGAPGQL